MIPLINLLGRNGSLSASEILPLPNVYAILASGGCMCPLIPDGRGVWIFENRPAAPGDLCCVWTRTDVKNDLLSCRLKFLINYTDGGIRIAMLNPLTYFTTLPGRLAAVHPLIAYQQKGGPIQIAEELNAAAAAFFTALPQNKLEKREQ